VLLLRRQLGRQLLRRQLRLQQQLRLQRRLRLLLSQSGGTGGPFGARFSLSKKSFRQAAALFQPLKRLKKWFDCTRKTTLTVFFHTIFPSEI